MTTPDEAELARQKRREEKERIRQENARKYQEEVPVLLKPLPEDWGYNQLVMEHQRLRMKIMEMQQLVITGKLHPQVEQDLEAQIVSQIHKVEARVAEVQGMGQGAVGQGKGPGF